MYAKSCKRAPSSPDGNPRCCGRYVSVSSVRTFRLPDNKLLPSMGESTQQPICGSSVDLKLSTIGQRLANEFSVVDGSPKVCGFMYNRCTTIYFCTRG